MGAVGDAIYGGSEGGGPWWAQLLFLAVLGSFAFFVAIQRRRERQRSGPKDPRLEKLRMVSMSRYRQEILNRSDA